MVTYHRSWPNLTARFGLNVVDYVEPRAGIPPSPAHLVDLIGMMKRENVKVILVEPYFDLKTPNSVAVRASPDGCKVDGQADGGRCRISRDPDARHGVPRRVHAQLDLLAQARALFRGRLPQVARDPLDPVRHVGDRGAIAARAHRGAHVVPLREQGAREVGADESRGAGDEDSQGV